MNYKVKYFIASVVFLAAVFIPFSGKAATLTVSPATGSYNPNDTFSISIYMNTNGQNVVVSAAYLNYDRNSFQAVSIDTADSAFTMETEKIIDSNNGIIKITRGKITPGVNGASILVAKVNFKALYGTTPTADNMTFSFVAGNNTLSTVIKDDGLGTNILSGVNNGKYTVSGAVNPAPAPIIPAPGGGLPGGSFDITPPAQVTNLTYLSTETQVLINWTNPTNGDYNKTKIVRKSIRKKKVPPTRSRDPS